jgi:hypothetical protein
VDPSESLTVIAILLVLILIELGAILVRLSRQNDLQKAANEKLDYQSERLRELVIGAKLPERPGSTQ